MSSRLITQISPKPGVYIFKNAQNKVLYVGKAVNLRHRVASYFSNPKDAKALELAKRVKKAETIIVESELEALILEANLIKKHLPLFNVRLTDDKDYLYIAVTKEAYPKVLTVRKKELAGVKKYWGPFPSSKTVRLTLKALRKVFPWCGNKSNTNKSNAHSWSGMRGIEYPLLEWKHKPCFYYHLGLCSGPCAEIISQKEYRKIINRFSKFLDGKAPELISQLRSEMMQLAKEQKFEEAGKIKKSLEGISYLLQPNKVKLYLENPNFLQEENKLALKQLQEELKLAKLPQRIEGYDISNISGKEATGSMVVLAHGGIDKSQYRKFRIRISGKPNDVGMMKEMIKRRLSHPEWSLPDLIIVDGGRGQAKAAKSEIQNSKLEVALFGLAKKREWLYPPEGDIIKLSKKSLSLKLLQKLRDEAHRFAVSYHRKLRGRILLDQMSNIKIKNSSFEF